MKKLNILAALLLWAIYPNFAQEYSRKFGKISRAEWELTKYDKDPKAEAVVLYDIGDSFFMNTDNGFDIRFKRTKRIKILDRSGTDHAEIVIPFYVDGYGKTETIESIKAYTYNLVDFKTVKIRVDPKTIYEEKINERWHAKKFVFPDVKEGSIIEFQYVLQSPFHFNLPDWEFQCKIPTVYSEYTAGMIPFYEYAFIAQGISKFSYQNSEVQNGVDRRFAGIEFHDYVHTYAMKDIPAFRDEAFISSPDHYLMKIDFQLSKLHFPTGGTNEIMTTWPKLNQSLLKHDKFGKYIKKSSKLAKSILETELKLTPGNSLETAKQVIEYVKSTFSWDGYYGKYTSKSSKNLIKEKSGNTADINLFLIALLRQAGVRCDPILVSTRSHGKVYPKYPFDHFFNYVIPMVHLGKTSFLADGTESLLPFDKIPPRCINEQGLVVREKEEMWISLENKNNSLDQKIIELTIDPEALLAKGTVSVLSTEMESYLYRSIYHNDSTKLKEEFLTNSFEKINRIRTRNYENESMPYSISFEGETPVEKIGDKIIVSPFLHFPIQKNKLTQEKRTYPVDFIYSKTKVLQSIVNIPAGMEVVSLPKEYKVDNDIAEIDVNFRKTSKGIEANGKYRFKKAVYSSKDYSNLKYYMDMIIKSFNKQVVLKKL